MVDLSDDPPRMTVQLAWTVLESGPGAMSLVIQWLGHAHGLAKAHLVGHESDRCISLTVEQDVLADNAGPQWQRLAFTTKRSTPIEHVSLNSPVKGRRIGGERMSERAVGSFAYLSVRGPGTLIIPALPSVLGLAVEDAVRVLDPQGFPARIEGDGVEIIAQHPSRGQIAQNRQAAAYDTGQPVTLVTR